MPIPKRNTGESKDAYISRCMEDSNMAEYPNDQRAAICYEQLGSEAPVFELKIDNPDEEGVYIMSLVDTPAIERNFVALSASKKYELAKVDEEKRMIVGPALVPNKLIVRDDGQGEYWIFFSEETVRKAAHGFLKNTNLHRVNIQHEVNVGGVYTVESWIVDDPETDKAKAMGFDVPKGTWMLAQYVESDTIWNELVKSGIVKGYSIEGNFVSYMVDSDEVTDEELAMAEALLMEELSKLI